MLKPPDPADEPPRNADAERPVGELVHQLVEDGKAYARSELGVVKAIASAKGKALAIPAGIVFVAMLVAQASVTVLAVATFALLQWALGTILAGIAAFLIFAALAGALAWYAVQRVKREL